MSERGPDFDELVGTDLEDGERQRLLRVHELLVEAGPPPELALRTPVALDPRRRRGAWVAIAARAVSRRMRRRSWRPLGRA